MRETADKFPSLAQLKHLAKTEKGESKVIAQEKIDDFRENEKQRKSNARAAQLASVKSSVLCEFEIAVASRSFTETNFTNYLLRSRLVGTADWKKQRQLGQAHFCRQGRVAPIYYF